MPLTITTNNHERPILTWWQLTDAERAQFPSIRDDGPDARSEFQAIRYGSQIFDLGEFEPTYAAFALPTFELPGADALEDWSAALCTSETTAIVIRFKSDFDTVIVGSAAW